MLIKQSPNRKTAPRVLASLVLHIAALMAIFFIYFPSEDNHLHYSIKDGKIFKKMSEVSNSLGEGYFVTWIIINENNFYYKDVIGCNLQTKHKNCVFSVKNLFLNPYYLESHIIDSQTYSFLDTMPSREVAFYKDFEKLKKYTTIHKMLDNTNLEIKRGGFTTIRNYKNNIVYVFIITDTNKTISHDKRMIVDLLKEIAQIGRRNL